MFQCIFSSFFRFRLVTTGSLAKWVECSPMVREIGVQSQVESYQRPKKKCYLIPPCLTFNIIRYVSRVKWSNPGKGVAPSPSPRCSSYLKGSFRVALDLGRQLYLLYYLMPKPSWRKNDNDTYLIQSGGGVRGGSHHHHHHRFMPLARISLTLSRHFSLSFIASGRSSGLHPVSSHNCCMYIRAGRPSFARPYVGLHRSTSLMSSSLLLQQCPACLVRLTWIVFVMGGRWPYSWCLVECCRQDLFNIACNILV